MPLAKIEIIRNGNINKIFDDANIKSALELAIKITTEAKSLAPVAEKHGGRLRNSIMYKTNKESGGFNDSSGENSQAKINVNPKEAEAFVGFNLLYGIYQEYGTRKMAPQPFFRPAIAIWSGQKAVDVIKKIHDEELRGKLKEGQMRETFF